TGFSIFWQSSLPRAMPQRVRLRLFFQAERRYGLKANAWRQSSPIWVQVGRLLCAPATQTSTSLTQNLAATEPFAFPRCIRVDAKARITHGPVARSQAGRNRPCPFA